MNATTFVPAASVTFSPDSASQNTFAMPAYDASNLDLVVTNNGFGAAYLSFAAGAPVGPNCAGNLVIPPGASVLLTSNAATLAATASNPLVQTGPQAAAASTSTSVSATVQVRSGSITITRGTATGRQTF